MAPPASELTRSPRGSVAAAWVSGFAIGALMMVLVMPSDLAGCAAGWLPQTRAAQAAKTSVESGTASVAMGTPAGDMNALLAARGAAAFGVQPGQSFDASAVKAIVGPGRTETIALSLPPGEGAEVKAEMGVGDGFSFHWSTTGNVAVDMHGEDPGIQGKYTSYWIDGAQRTGAGSFIAPFAGHHGWYWLNRGGQPVTVLVSVTGFQRRLFRLGH